MSHLIIAPVVLPACLGAVILLAMRTDLVLQRVFSIAGTTALLGIALYLNWLASGGEITVYRLGNWPAPFGIVLMLDRLAALMLLLTAVLALAVQLYALGSGWDRKGWHFHALWQFQLMGVSGAFLTGDAFNLFVFFEVLLIASYGLMLHGGGALRLRAGMQYVVYNLAGSTLFLIALGTLYAVTGTLNMADMAVRVAALPPEHSAMLRAGAVLLMLVFAVKAALVPLHFWLPATYANAPGPVAAFFAIMTKVGVYAILRFFTLVFPQGGTIGTLAVDLLLPAALLTLLIGQIGVLGARNLNRMAAFAAIGSIGTLVIALSQFTQSGLAAGIYYLIHSTLAAGALFLIVDLIGARRGDLWLRPERPIAQAGLIGAFYFAVAIAVTGMPPLSGFIGKLMVMEATAAAAQWVLIWSVILISSLIAIAGMMRAGSVVFWKAREIGAAAEHPSDPHAGLKLEPDEPVQDAADAPSPALAFAAVGALLAGLALLTAFAGPVADYAQAIAAQLQDPGAYVGEVLIRQEGTR
ncbi:monovalent cation/H+ antiporter subunit D [Paracoccus aminophilus]|uniref:Multicomponent K+:H+ antiporter, subunit D n=1 Tax=Paracoccus aminophilus JCM 7686 TaxID=1367847 RepID=S5YQS8_PARAH|nr:monovalent cation/H+ antiporter subunit D [Paracoccus aminophilus]AGT07596.1 multicomponent K+:H+ antiporter, subunit D [Paracoccus aminophilus JCM 7686]